MTNLGKIPDGPEGERDAVHVATEIRVATRRMPPGCIVDAFGIADPFRERHIETGEKYLYCLRPGLVGDMRHQWSYDKLPQKEETAEELMAKLRAMIPAAAMIPRSDSVEASEKWLRDFCNTYMDGFTFESFIDALRQANRTGYGYVIEGSTEPDATRTQQEQIWLHFSIFTGEKVDPSNTTFTCSC